MFKNIAFIICLFFTVQGIAQEIADQETPIRVSINTPENIMKLRHLRQGDRVNLTIRINVTADEEFNSLKYFNSKIMDYGKGHFSFHHYLEETAKQTLGPFNLEYHGVKVITDSIVVDVQPRLTIKEKVNFIYEKLGDSLVYMKMEQVDNSKLVDRSNSFGLVRKVFIPNVKEIYSCNGAIGPYITGQTGLNYFYNIYIFRIIDPSIPVAIPVESFANVPEGFRVHDVMIE